MEIYLLRSYFMICDPSTRRLGVMIKSQFRNRLPVNYPEAQQCSLFLPPPPFPTPTSSPRTTHSLLPPPPHPPGQGRPRRPLRELPQPIELQLRPHQASYPRAQVPCGTVGPQRSQLQDLQEVRGRREGKCVTLPSTTTKTTPPFSSRRLALLAAPPPPAQHLPRTLW